MFPPQLDRPSYYSILLHISVSNCYQMRAAVYFCPALLCSTQTGTSTHSDGNRLILQQSVCISAIYFCVQLVFSCMRGAHASQQTPQASVEKNRSVEKQDTRSDQYMENGKDLITHVKSSGLFC